MFLRWTIPSRLGLRWYNILLLRLSILSFRSDHLVHRTATTNIIAYVTIILWELQMTQLRELCDLLGLILQDEIAETYLFLIIALVNVFWTSARQLLVIVLTHDVFYKSLLLLLQILLKELLGLLLILIGGRLISFCSIAVFFELILIFLC